MKPTKASNRHRRAIKVNCECGWQLEAGMRYCPGCGRHVGRDPSQSISSGGGDMTGVFQAGRDIILGPAPQEGPSYNAEPIWRSPFTLGILSWAGVGLGVLSLLPLFKIFEPLVAFLLSRGRAGLPPANIGWAILFLVVALALAGALSLRRLVRDRLRIPALVPGWALSGSSGRVTLERVRTGGCPKCGGRMRYYNKATEGIDRWSESGGSRREVTERTPALECRRNPKHWYEVDPADEP